MSTGTHTFGISSICSAFTDNTIGSRVLGSGDFKANLSTALDTYDVSKDRVPGQHFIEFPNTVGCLSLVSAGVGKIKGRTADDYVVREHRGECAAYLKREFAEPVTGVACVLYTLEAYKSDPEVDMSKESFGDDVSHVIVAVLAYAGPKSPLSSKRFVSNLAGGNKEALTWDADEIRTKAEEINNYHSEWTVVAD